MQQGDSNKSTKLFKRLVQNRFYKYKSDALCISISIQNYLHYLTPWKVRDWRMQYRNYRRVLQLQFCFPSPLQLGYPRLHTPVISSVSTTWERPQRSSWVHGRAYMLHTVSYCAVLFEWYHTVAFTWFVKMIWFDIMYHMQLWSTNVCVSK